MKELFPLYYFQKKLTEDQSHVHDILKSESDTWRRLYEEERKKNEVHTYITLCDYVCSYVPVHNYVHTMCVHGYVTTAIFTFIASTMIT